MDLTSPRRFGYNEGKLSNGAVTCADCFFVSSGAVTGKRSQRLMNMSYSQSGLALTEGFESCRLAAYQDLKGVWTIGYGHTGPDVNDGLTITQDQADALLLADVKNAEDHVNNLVTVALTQAQFDALVDFAFNCGCAAFAGSTMLKLLNQGDYSSAAAQLDLWDHASGKVVAGLLRRRQAETDEFDATDVA
jgi:lysozyme